MNWDHFIIFGHGVLAGVALTIFWRWTNTPREWPSRPKAPPIVRSGESPSSAERVA